MRREVTPDGRVHKDRGTWAYYSLIYRALTRGCIAIVVTL